MPNKKSEDPTDILACKVYLIEMANNSVDKLL